MQEKNVLPEGWYDEFFERADLEGSFDLLHGNDHFYAEAMRGRIRSLQVRLKDAWTHFDKATALAAGAPVTIPNLVRQFLLNLYLFDNALLQEPLDREAKIPVAKIPELPPKVSTEFPEVAHVIELRLSAEGYLRLHVGEYEIARKVFKKLVSSYARGPDATLSVYYCGLAAAERNLGLEDLAERTLENAALAVQAGGSTLNRVRASSVLYAFRTWLDELEEAEGWRQFLLRLECPEDTKEAFLRRSNILIERCSQEECLLLL